MAWTKVAPKKEGKFWIKIPEFSYPVIGDIFKVRGGYKIYVGSYAYKLDELEALYWDEPVFVPPLPNENDLK